MPQPPFLDTRNNSPVAVAICDRCGFKVPWASLVPDGNIHALRVCNSPECRDTIDPYRLPPPPPDKIGLKWARPDVQLTPWVYVPEPVVPDTLTEEEQG